MLSLGYQFRLFLFHFVGCFMSAQSIPLVGFCGPRVAPSGAAPVVSGLVSSVLSAGRGVASGCAAGVDSLAVSSAVRGGARGHLSVFCAFGPSGLGAVGSWFCPLVVVCKARSVCLARRFLGGLGARRLSGVLLPCGCPSGCAVAGVCSCCRGVWFRLWFGRGCV